MMNGKDVHNPILLSQRLSTEKDIEDRGVSIPVKDSEGNTVGRFQIHFFAEKGEGIVFFSSKENTPPLRIPEGRSWNVRFLGLQECSNFIATVKRGNVLCFTVEKLR